MIATAVNDIPGVWVSFQIEGDDYWVAISPDRFEHVPGLQWLWWSIAALVLSVLGAAFITSRVNQPLKRLADTARAISAGDDPKSLPEGGGTEVAQANHSFNQMVRDLKQLEADRAVMLAGISHDLRTPLTRLRLETEMSPVDDQTRELMVADIEQMDAIIGQFLDYARPSGEMLEAVDLTELVRDTAPVYSAHDDIDLTLKLAPEAIARCNRMETQRILDNLIENARRYGKTHDTGRAEITVSTALQGNEVVLCVADRGAGVPADQPGAVDAAVLPAGIRAQRGQGRGPRHVDREPDPAAQRRPPHAGEPHAARDRAGRQRLLRTRLIRPACVVHAAGHDGCLADCSTFTHRCRPRRAASARRLPAWPARFLFAGRRPLHPLRRKPMKTIGDKLEPFKVIGVKPGFNRHEENGQSAFEDITEASFPGKWKVIYFYPKDFTFVCPTEIVAFARLNQDFEDRDTVVLGGSTDNEFVKLAWRREHKDLDRLKQWSFADTTGALIDQPGRARARSRRRAAGHVHRRSGQRDPARLGEQPERGPQPG